SYQVTLVAGSAGPVTTTSGLVLQADQDFTTARARQTPIDTLIVAGGHGVLTALDDEPLLDYLRWAADRATRVVSICTGAMLLAELGMLNGKRATTHWWWCPVLERQYPDVKIEPDALYVRDGRFWTSAGVTSGMDLALALIEEDLGYDIAIQVARYNVMFMMRPGGQSQFSTQLLAQQANAEGAIGESVAYILDNVAANLTVTALAARACMSERSYARKFKQATRLTPAQYVEAARLQAARVALEQGTEHVDTIARKVGFGHPERMRRCFQRHLGVAPVDYRERFRRRRPMR
ncbi:MAG: DJ-1/PfpI family protein, partial [Halioglobus sp.]|nr:DJ-1/PfpI family protein [Halioglobus sp.]